MSIPDCSHLFLPAMRSHRNTAPERISVALERRTWPVYVVGPPGYPAACELAQQLSIHTDRPYNHYHGNTEVLAQQLTAPSSPGVIMAGRPVQQLLPQIVEQATQALFVLAIPQQPTFRSWLQQDNQRQLGFQTDLLSQEVLDEMCDAYNKTVARTLRPAWLEGRVKQLSHTWREPVDYLPFFGIQPTDPEWRKALPLYLPSLEVLPPHLPEEACWWTGLLQMLTDSTVSLLDRVGDLEKELEQTKKRLEQASMEEAKRHYSLDEIADSLLNKYRQQQAKTAC